MIKKFLINTLTITNSATNKSFRLSNLYLSDIEYQEAITENNERHMIPESFTVFCFDDLDLIKLFEMLYDIKFGWFQKILLRLLTKNKYRM